MLTDQDININIFFTFKIEQFFTLVLLRVRTRWKLPSRSKVKSKDAVFPTSVLEGK